MEKSDCKSSSLRHKANGLAQDVGFREERAMRWNYPGMKEIWLEKAISRRIRLKQTAPPAQPIREPPEEQVGCTGGAELRLQSVVTGKQMQTKDRT